jgi:hypothetical protein
MSDPFLNHPEVVERVARALFHPGGDYLMGVDFDNAYWDDLEDRDQDALRSVARIALATVEEMLVTRKNQEQEPDA